MQLYLEDLKNQITNLDYEINYIISSYVFLKTHKLINFEQSNPSRVEVLLKRKVVRENVIKLRENR